MQTLFYETRTRDGEVHQKEVNVVRAFSNLATTVYLHANGVYGYKDGSPVQSLSELEEMIKNPNQFRLAKSWWDRKGKELSGNYYSLKEEEERNRLMQYEEVVAASELDSQTYARVSEDGKEVLGPSSWMEYFSVRPEWWGKAKRVDLGDYMYIREDVYASGEEKKGTAKTGSKKTVSPEEL